jgi:uncharacterized protein with gpF-like domain
MEKWSVELDPMFLNEALEFFKSKGYIISANIADIEPLIHSIAFTASRITKIELLIALKEEITKSIEQGMPYNEFRKNIMQRFSEMGMWGDDVTQDDPVTGESFKVNMNVSRIKKIFDTNIRVMHAEGQWQRIKDYSDMFPYLVYDAGNSEVPRKEHLVYDGLTLPIDDPFWQLHTPVKAYGCKCRVYQSDEIEAGAKTAAPKEKYYTHKNNDGTTQEIPVGVDPSFNYPLGSAGKALAEYLSQKLSEV